jgi:hypothetical protein
MHKIAGVPSFRHEAGRLPFRPPITHSRSDGDVGFLLSWVGKGYGGNLPLLMFVPSPEAREIKYGAGVRTARTKMRNLVT